MSSRAQAVDDELLQSIREAEDELLVAQLEEAFHLHDATLTSEQDEVEAPVEVEEEPFLRPPSRRDQLKEQFKDFSSRATYRVQQAIPIVAPHAWKIATVVLFIIMIALSAALAKQRKSNSASVPCQVLADCQGIGPCGYESAIFTSRKVCCPTGTERVALDFGGLGNVCRDRTLGTYCGTSDSICASNLCINTRCSVPLANGRPCTHDRGCESRQCGRSIQSDGEQVCCNQVLDGFCVETKVKTGSRCQQFDQFCASGVCGVNGLCAGGKLRDNEVCERAVQCQKGVCAYSSSRTGDKVCCASGASIMGELQNGLTAPLCTQAPLGTSCHVDGPNDMCASGRCVNGLCAPPPLSDNSRCTHNNDCESGACGLQDADYGSPSICCPSGKTITGSVRFGAETRQNQEVCSARSVGTFCHNLNECCETGLCIDSKCAATALDDGNECRENTDCKNGQCALAEADPSSPAVCCEQGLVLSTLVRGSSIYGTEQRVCSQLQEGAYCHSNDNLCLVGTCLRGECRSEKLEDMAKCDSNTECRSGACALSSSDKVQPKTCCATGKSINRYDSAVHMYQDYCASMPSNSSCGRDDVCMSGACISGTCADSLLDDGRICSVGGHCTSGACGLSQANATAPRICCESGATSRVQVFGSVQSFAVCTELPDGTFCLYDDGICKSDLCLHQHCAQKQEAAAKCERDSECRSDQCALAIADTAAPTTCCPSELTVYEYARHGTTTARRHMCGGAPVGTFCHTVDEMCASGLCINSTCAETALDEGTVCVENSDCLSGSCALKDANSTSPRVCCGSGTVSSTVLGGFSQPSYYSQSSYYSNSVCVGLENGAFCNGNSLLCQSGICLRGYCAQERLNETVICSTDSECKSGRCALAAADSSLPTTCCTTSRAVSGLASQDLHTTRANMCADAPIGTYCRNVNEMCASGLCINSTCVVTALDTGASCAENDDCIDGACALADANSTSSKICCESGSSTSIYVSDGGYSRYQSVCTGLKQDAYCSNGDNICASGICIRGYCQEERFEAGEQCLGDSECKSGRCALAVADLSESKTCCETNTDLSGYARQGSTSQWTSLCTNAAAGTYCHSDNDSMCASSVCVEGVCVNQTLAANERCSKNSHCQEGACARVRAHPDAPTVCCASGKSFNGVATRDAHQRSLWSSTQRYSMCTDLPSGTYCHIHSNQEMCSSGLCVNGTCAESLLDNGATCSVDADCDSGACGLSDASGTSKRVCCTSGKTINTRVIRGRSYISADVCTQLSNGSSCGTTPSLCESGICLQEVCRAEKLNPDEECTQASDCKSDACARGVADSSSPTVCCASGQTISGYGLNGYMRVCTRMPLGTYCYQIDEMCLSSHCVSGTCTEHQLDNNAQCNSSADCKSYACGREEARSSSPFICCPSGRVTSGFITSSREQQQSSAVCTNSQTGTYCGAAGDDGEGLHAMCASGLCVNMYCT